MDAPRVCAVILNYRQLDLTLACLQSFRNLTYPNLDVLVVDNGSGDGSAAVIRERFPDLKVLDLRENRGFTGGMNAGIREAIERRGAQYVYVLNNDTLFPDPRLVDKLIAAFEEDDRAGLAGSTVVDYHDPTQVQFGGPEHTALGVLGVPGCGFLASRRMLEEIGLFDENFFSYHEESDLFARALAHGWTMKYVPDATLQHMSGSPSSGDWSPFKAYYAGRNFYIFARKNAQGPGHFLKMLWGWQVKGSAWSLKEMAKRGAWKPMLSHIKGHAHGVAWLLRPRVPPEPRLVAGGEDA